jgi:hypothetical protein
MIDIDECGLPAPHGFGVPDHLLHGMELFAPVVGELDDVAVGRARNRRLEAVHAGLGLHAIDAARIA